MSFLPKINLRRTFLIARRDYLGYVKTWGFWISFLLPFVFGGFGFFAATADIDLTPTQYVTVIDETGMHGQRFHNLYDEMIDCLLYTSPSPRDRQKSRMPSSA